MFRSKPFEDALDKVKTAGLRAFEFWGARGKDVDAIRRRKQDLGLELAIFRWDTGGPLLAPDTRDKIADAIQESIRVAKKLNCKRFLGVAGREIPGLSRSEQHKNIVASLKAAAPILEDTGITLSIEPQNNILDGPNFFLWSTKEALEIIEQVDSPNIKLLFDVYHHQVSHGNLIYDIKNNIEKIGYFQIADVPGGGQPGTGEINFVNVFRAIAEAGYEGHIGLEMKPIGNHTQAV